MGIKESPEGYAWLGGDYAWLKVSDVKLKAARGTGQDSNLVFLSVDGESWWACDYDVYNAGSNTISSSQDWAITLLYYNAYNANDYGILLLDYYTDDFGTKGKMEGTWDATDAYNYFGFSSSANISGFAWNNIDVKSGQSCNEACGGTVGSTFMWPFKLPNLSGKYYLVLVADAFLRQHFGDR